MLNISMGRVCAISCNSPVMSLALAVIVHSAVNGGVNHTDRISGSELPAEIVNSEESYKEFSVNADSSTDRVSKNALELTPIPISTLSSSKSPSLSNPSTFSMVNSAGSVTWLALTEKLPVG